MALIENGFQIRSVLAQGTVTLNGVTAVAVALTQVEATSIILLSLNTVGATAGATQPYVSAVTPGTGFSVKSGTASANDVLNYLVINQNP
jgi:hypothetical protein